ncbi:PREDICTED: uncharacterized protein LOC108778191 [Cyphomyrmex costatus]|uniref:uncharacterized protein LOC108778191 n=1 Tax=Cyphomyrmex costatus TaxID=456900 RepID=UPI000852402E|nr:PREDICTED: uncharacterized protein LOC108778191 [Cyphomyrmex costatus]
MQQQIVRQFPIPQYDPAKNSIFASVAMSLEEVNLYKRITPSAPTLMDISRRVYFDLFLYDLNVRKKILPEYLDYYSTSLLWFRIVSLKMKHFQPITPEERDLLLILQQFSFTIPEPILLQLQVFGSVQTRTGEHLYPWFPKLPTSQIGEYGGFYGPVTKDNHNLYEEIPCLGVLSEAVRQSISDAPPGQYASSLNTDELTMTENLLGYFPLGIRDNEAKNIAFDAGIKVDLFPSYPYNTGMNLKLIMSISNIIAQTKVFELFTVNFNDLAKEGSVIQTVMVHPISPKIRGQQEKHGKLQVTSLMSEYFSLTAGIVFCPQLWKKGSTKTSAKSWSCAVPVNKTWITNRNERRTTLPVQYRQEVFKLTPEFGQSYRSQVIKFLIMKKRNAIQH